MKTSVTIHVTKNDPSKAEEIAALEGLANLLGPHSYLDPWLNSIRWEVEKDVRNDIFPTITLTEARTRVQTAIDDANDKASKIWEKADNEAARIIAGANAKAASILTEAEKRIERINGEHRDALCKLRHVLNSPELS